MDYYMLRLKNSNLIVEETFIESEVDERYILFGELDPSRYTEILAMAIIEEFKEFNFVMFLHRMDFIEGEENG